MKNIKKRYNGFKNILIPAAQAAGIRKVAATVSGGADSVALLSALTECGIFEVTALHCNFHLRGEESMRDQHFVEELCRRLEVDLTVKDFDTLEYIRDNKGTSLEMACRELRYAWFRDTAAEIGADRIATGHNADDNIETMLLNLFRGSGTSGLRGMSPDNGEIWRPLLSVHRTEITEYLAGKGLTFITDSSNLTSDYRRNFIRNEVIPLLQTRWPGLKRSLDRSILLLREDNKVVSSTLNSVLSEATTELGTETIMEFPSPVLLIRRFIEPLRPFTTTAGEIIEAIKADKPHARRWALPLGNIELRNHTLRILRKRIEN